MARLTESPKDSALRRTFRNITREQLADPDNLEAFETMGLGGQFGWDELRETPRVLVVSAAGAGKTHECRDQADRLFAEGRAAFFLTLEGVSTTDLRLLLDRNQFERFSQWLADGHSEAHFFLDSADELLLSHGDFRQALRKLALAIDGQLHRARIVVTSRPIGVDLEAFSKELPVIAPPPEPEIADGPNDPFRRLISGETQKKHHEVAQKQDEKDPQTGVRIVGLTSLSRQQIETLAAARGVTDVAALVAEIDRKRAWEFARRPQELIETCSYWKEHGRLGTHSEQVAEDIRRKLQETGGRTRHIRLSEAKVLEGAERLALAQVLTRKRTIRFSDLSLDSIEPEAAIDPSIILADWNASDRSELLQRPLFGPASYGRVRFHHRSASEFLAAQRLHRLCRDGHMSRSALFRLLFGECYDQELVFPSMRAVAAWLAIDNDAVRDEMLRREPEALMDEGDPESFPISTRSRVLAEYVQRYGKDGWRGVRIPYPQVLRFASPDLSPTVRHLWLAGSTSPEVRELLIALVQVGRMADCLDIAAGVANDSSASEADRITAIAALAEMSRSGDLANLVESLLKDSQWPSRVKAGVMETLFPEHMTIDQFVEMLGQIEFNKHSAGDIAWTLPRLIPLMKLTAEQTSNFRSALSQLIESGIEARDSWPHYASRYGHFSSALARLCLEGLDQGSAPESDLVKAAVLANRFRENEYGDDKRGAELVSRFHQAPRGWRKNVFIAEGRFCAAHVPSRNEDEFCVHLTYETLASPVEYDDFDWLIDVSCEASVERRTRAAAFREAMFCLQREGNRDEGRLKRLREAAQGEVGWSEKLEAWLTVPKRNEEHAALSRKWKKDADTHKAKEKVAIESWVNWRDEVLRDPDSYFAKASTGRVVWDFAQVLERDPEERGWRAHWSHAFIVEHFSEDIAKRVREAFCAYWRTIKVPLRSERPEAELNTVWSKWVYALVGGYAEAEDPDWGSRLKPKEAERAARLAPVELNGVPPWVKDLVVCQPKAVDKTLGRELSAQLNDAVSFEYPGLLADFSRAEQPVVEFFAHRVWSWLSTTEAAFEGERQQARMYDHLERAIDFVMRGSIERAKLSALARDRLEQGFGEPFVLLWLMALLAISPDTAIKTLVQSIGRLDPTVRYRLSENLFAAFSDSSSARLCPDLSDPCFTPDLLLNLIGLAYAEIRLADDIDRVGTGTYSPTVRDKAQHGRSAVLGALLARTGPQAWTIKQAMRSDPRFAHFKDRLDQLAREKAASEAEGPAFADTAVAQIEQFGEAPQADRGGMFRLMMDRLADLQHDIAAHEFSERSILVGIDKERDMQVWFAKRLQERENGAYKVDREAMVIHAKKTDIRLLSVTSHAQAVIEMKLANNECSLQKLHDAIEVQLVGQYMQHENCRAGCLLVTMNRERGWSCPDSGVKLDFAAVISRLQGHATELQTRMHHEIRLAVLGIDLTR